MKTFLSAQLRSGRGIGLIEIVVGVSLTTVILLLCINAVSAFYVDSTRSSENLTATYLAEEGIESLRYMRDADWTTISLIPVDTARYLTFSTSTIAATTTPEYIGTFGRTFYIHNVYRALSGDDIVSSTSSQSKIIDPDTKRVEMRVVSSEGDTDVTLEAYIINIWGE